MHQYNEIQSKINTDITNGKTTLPELMRFFKAKNLVQTEKTWLMSGDKNAKCFRNMNNYIVSGSQGRRLIHYLIGIFLGMTIMQCV
jgi:hypothetical protein